MINFVICEDEKELRKIEVDEVTKFMMNYDLDYEIHEFNDYDDKFYDYAKKENGFKIYLLDIVTKNASGLNAVRTIREGYDDWVSVIMMITSHSEYKYEALSSRLYLLDFINKLNNMEEKIQDNLKVAIKHYDNRHKQIKYMYNRNLYNIEFREIIYIEKEPDSKRCVVKTKYGKQIIPGTLNNVYKMLDKRFLKVHKSLIVNLDEIREFELSTNKLTFKNGDITYLVSRNKKKELMGNVNDVN